jgi:hypothetical protein
MKSTYSVWVGSFLVAVALLGVATIQSQTSGSQKTLTGVVSDSMCGVNHMAKNIDPADCLRMCVKKGTKYALVVGKDVYTLEGHEAELDKYAAQEVSLKGTVKGKMMTVESVTRAK